MEAVRKRPVLPWRHTLALEKVAIEVRDVVETDVIADAADLAVRMEQQLASLADAQLRHEGSESGAGDSAELPRERGSAIGYLRRCRPSCPCALRACGSRSSAQVHAGERQRPRTVRVPGSP